MIVDVTGPDSAIIQGTKPNGDGGRSYGGGQGGGGGGYGGSGGYIGLVVTFAIIVIGGFVCDLGSDDVYVNSALYIYMFHMLQCFNIYECDNSFSVCVWVQVEYHFVSGEPTYDEFHAGDGETQPFLGKCSDKCDIGTCDFISYVIFP